MIIILMTIIRVKNYFVFQRSNIYNCLVENLYSYLYEIWSKLQKVRRVRNETKKSATGPSNSRALVCYRAAPRALSN